MQLSALSVEKVVLGGPVEGRVQALGSGHSKQREENKPKPQRMCQGPVSSPEMPEHSCRPRPGTATVAKAGRLA